MTGVRAVLRAPLPRALLLALLILMLAAWAARAEPLPLRAHVVWARDTRVMLAADGDSLEVEYDQSVTFQRHGKPIAFGQISGRVARELALVTLGWGSIDPPKSWDDLEILVEPTNQPRPKLRLGIPGRGRGSLLFSCDPLPPARLIAPGTYNIVRSTDRFVRAVLFQSGQLGPWPDTLEIRGFAEASDEEIALERGELDVAVFWAGELSREMRDRPQWENFLLGYERVGIVAARWIGSDSVSDVDLERWVTPAMDSLNQDQFRGDLVPIWTPAMGGPQFNRDRPPTQPKDPPAPLRYVVDPKCPGKRAMERSLNRGTLLGPGSAANVLITFLDKPTFSPESTGFAYIFALGSPVLCPPQLRAYVRALDQSNLANFPSCHEPRRRP